MAEINAALVDDAGDSWASLFGGLANYLVPDDAPPTAGWNPKITHFRIGEGGWVDNGAGPVPRTPVTNLRMLTGETSAITGDRPQDLDANVDATRALIDQRYPANRRFVFEKAFVPGDIVLVSPGILRCFCNLTTLEANNNGFGFNPDFWEIGLFSVNPDPLLVNKLLIAYATFPKVTKTGAAPAPFYVRLYFRGQP